MSSDCFVTDVLTPVPAVVISSEEDKHMLARFRLARRQFSLAIT